MRLFILDTDTLSLLQSGNAAVAARAATCTPGEIAITVITVDEQLRGWFTLVRRAKRPPQIAFAYGELARSVSALSKTRILSFTEAAIGRVEQLKKAKLGVRANDLRIASIALENGGTVVTRNVSDFTCVPGLIVEDWARP